MELNCNGRLLPLCTSIRLDWKLIGVTNTLAYYDIATIIGVISFIVQSLGANVVEHFNAVNYNHSSAIQSLCVIT